MDAQELVGATLLAGLVVFLVGAGGWRMAYEQPMVESLRVIHGDRRRRAWIHLWMIPALFLTPAGIAGVAVGVVADPVAIVLAAMAATVYAVGAVCWVASLAFRLTVVPWAAERTVADGTPPDAFPALDACAGSLYAVHMTSGYVASAMLGGALLVDGATATWLGWAGVGWGLAWAAGIVATRYSGPFNPPFWTHLYTGVVGGMLLWG